MKRSVLLALLVSAAATAAFAQAPISTRPAQEPAQPQMAEESTSLDQPTQSQVEAAQWGRDVLARADGRLPPSDDRLAQAGASGKGGCVRNPDRAPHGAGSVSVGTGGYKAADVFMTQPIGDCSQLSIGVSTSRGGRGYYGRGYGPY